MQNQLMSINKASFTILSMKRTWTTNRKVACKHTTQVEAAIKEEVMQRMSKVLKKLCNEKLMI